METPHIKHTPSTYILLLVVAFLVVSMVCCVSFAFAAEDSFPEEATGSLVAQESTTEVFITAAPAKDMAAHPELSSTKGNTLSPQTGGGPRLVIFVVFTLAALGCFIASYTVQKKEDRYV